MEPFDPSEALEVMVSNNSLDSYPTLGSDNYFHEITNWNIDSDEAVSIAEYHKKEYGVDQEILPNHVSLQGRENNDSYWCVSYPVWDDNGFMNYTQIHINANTGEVIEHNGGSFLTVDTTLTYICLGIFALVVIVIIVALAITGQRQAKKNEEKRKTEDQEKKAKVEKNPYSKR